MPNTLRTTVLLLGLALAPLAAPRPLAAQAQNEAPPRGEGAQSWHPEALEAIDELKSPYCPALMLEVCPSPGGAALRDTLQMLAADSGMTSDSIVNWVVAKYGEEWRALPKAEGRSLVAWLVPPLAVVLGIAGVVVVLRRIRRPTEGPAADEVSDEERARLDAAIRELETEEEPLF